MRPVGAGTWREKSGSAFRSGAINSPARGSHVRSAAGGLIFYGPIVRDLNRIGASYVDRILRGSTVSDLPVQSPTKLELVVNLETAKALGVTIPEGFFLRADELIE
jgi:putative ABC transport system substrate-binding protein